MSLLAFIFIFFTIYLAGAIAMLTLRNLVIRSWKSHDELLMVLIVALVTGLLSFIYGSFTVVLLTLLFITISSITAGKILFKNYSYSGINFYIANLFMIVVGVIWGFQFFSNQNISMTTKLLLLSTAPLLLITLPLTIFQLVEKFDIICREKWNRPRKPSRIRYGDNAPMVSLHVPAHSEPPEIVIETLNKITELDYQNYEVLVIDNNTTDKNLWQPVQAHCKRLGKKFRFFHLENIKGAKAGALNFALKHTDPKAEIIGVIDADYHTEPNFLKELVGLFKKKKLGFVQTPHDYRDWKHNLYLRMCYWEYKLFFHSDLISLNERDATITVGTMCLIRKKALEDAGGWAEWCVTEDSELAIRIHDAGYSSMYVNKTYGRGLIPETFETFKKQRYRWTAGPVQEFFHHFKDYFGISKKSSKWTMLQRIHHLNHGMNNVLIGLTIPLTIIGLLVIASLIYHKEIIPVPFELWLASTITLTSTFLLDWLMYKVTINPSLKDLLGKYLAGKALVHVITYAAFRTLVTGNAKWNRTNKFKSEVSYKSALYATKEETIIGIFLTTFIAIAYYLFPYPGVSLMLLIGASYSALSYFAAPVISIINVFAMKESSSIIKSRFNDIPYISVGNFYDPMLHPTRNLYTFKKFYHHVENNLLFNRRNKS